MVDASPVIMVTIAPARFMRFQKIPRKMIGNSDAAAIPKANATTCATKPNCDA